MKRRQILLGTIAATLAGLAKSRSVFSANRLSLDAWNALSRDLIIQHRLDPVYASYVLFAVAVSQAIALADQSEPTPDSMADSPGWASLLALNTLLPKDERIAALTADYQTDLSAPEHAPIIKAVSRFLQKRINEGAEERMPVVEPTGKDVWRSLDNRPPLRPTWGTVKYFGIEVDPVAVCPKPFSVGSADFIQELNTVKTIAKNASPKQIESVHYWADTIGTVTPPGHWNQLIEQFLMNRSVSDRIFGLALAQIAMFNAGIACWCVKYHYWYPRPSQMDPTMTTHFKVPNFPSFPSGHSCFSWSVAKSLVIAFPDLSARLTPLAEEASQSRVLGGIHYPMDCSAGKILGSYIGELTAKQFINLEKVIDRAG
ncbi:MAG: phosphatase PAP2 family protein [Thermosynechococcaceae cyanobacterium]